MLAPSGTTPQQVLPKTVDVVTQMTFDVPGFEITVSHAAIAAPKPARKRGPRVLTRQTAAILQIPLDLLDQPIAGLNVNGLSKALLEIQEDFGDLDVNDDDELDAASAAVGLGNSVDPSASREAARPPQWSDQAILELYDGVLRYSLTALGGRRNANEKREILCWFFSPDVHSWSARKTADGDTYYRPIKAVHIPFTFQNCCAMCGLDQERIREGLVTVLRKAGYPHIPAV